MNVFKKLTVAAILAALVMSAINFTVMCIFRPETTSAHEVGQYTDAIIEMKQVQLEAEKLGALLLAGSEDAESPAAIEEQFLQLAMGMEELMAAFPESASVENAAIVGKLQELGNKMTLLAASGQLYEPESARGLVQITDEVSAMLEEAIGANRAWIDNLLANAGQESAQRGIITGNLFIYTFILLGAALVFAILSRPKARQAPFYPPNNPPR